MGILKRQLSQFDRTFDGAWEQREAKGNTQRQDFVRRYPLDQINRLSLNKYAIGIRHCEGFCYWAEAGTRQWASMQGGNAMKFGIYYGTFGKSSPRQYRFKAAYGSRETRPEIAFHSVRKNLVDLLSAGKSKNFDAIDRNELPQVFKAKLLSLYFPKTFINICSEQALSHFSKILGVRVEGCAEKQYELLLAKKNLAPLGWSTWKFTRFLFQTFPYREDPADAPPRRIIKSGKPSDREPDFEELQRLLREIGEKSEKFARKWEEARLAGTDLRWSIKDRGKSPGYGYDLETIVDGNVQRCIEVKTARYKAAVGYRFFVTGHEFRTSLKKEDYWFYFVEWNAKGPRRVHPMTAAELHQLQCLQPDGYIGFIQLLSSE